QPDVVAHQVVEDAPDAADLVVLVEDQADDVAHLLVGVQVNAIRGELDIAQRHVVEEFAAPGLVQPASLQSISHSHKLKFADRALGTWNIMHKLQILGHAGGGRSFASSGIDAGRGPGSGRCGMASGKEMSHGSSSNSPRANGSLSPPPGRTSRARLSP